jgi:hypothetical protein
MTSYASNTPPLHTNSSRDVLIEFWLLNERYDTTVVAVKTMKRGLEFGLVCTSKGDLCGVCWVCACVRLHVHLHQREAVGRVVGGRVVVPHLVSPPACFASIANRLLLHSTHRAEQASV